MSTAMPETVLDDLTMTAFDMQFEPMYEVVILDSDTTSFFEVIVACVVLFQYEKEEAQAIADKVDATGEASVHVAEKKEAEKYKTALATFNVLSEVRPVTQGDPSAD